MSAAATINLITYTDADYFQAFRVEVSVGVFYDFVNCSMLMKVRKQPEDVEVFLSIESRLDGIPVDESGIDIYQPDGETGLVEFAIVICRNDLGRIPEGEYAQSLILVTPDGLHSDIWRGTLINSIGPTR